jgi:hypothetical protein
MRLANCECQCTQLLGFCEFSCDVIRLRELGFKAERPKPGELKTVHAYDNLGGI